MALILLICSAFFFLYVGYLFREGKRSEKWLKVRGKIRDITFRSESDGDGGFVHIPEVHYFYVADGRVREGKLVWVHSYKGNSLEDAQELVEHYRSGQSVIVYFNPRNPGQSYLEPGIPEIIWQYLIIALIFLSVAIWSFVISDGR